MVTVNALLYTMLSLASCQTMEPINNCCDSSNVIIVETENQFSLSLKLVTNECIDSCYFISHVYAPVCEEKVCYPIVLEMKWDILGYFKDYKTPLDSPLTKFDHQPFTKGDHAKMRSILSNKYSVLRDIKVGDLIDRHTTIKSTVLDGVTSATRTSLKKEVVGGAVYSTYTLWHLVNGVAADSIRKKTELQVDSVLLRKFLVSSNPNYHYFALEKLSDGQEMRLTNEIIRLIEFGEGNVPFFAYDRLSQNAWNDTAYQIRLVSLIGSVDFKLKNAILNQLFDVSLSVTSLDTLISKLDQLTTQQQVKALTIIERNIPKLTSNAGACLTLFKDRNDNEEVARQTSRILKLWHNHL